MFKSVSIRQLEYIRHVANIGSITQTAQLINISPSSIREAITIAETELGVRLFFRTPAKGVSLTTEGQRFLLLAEPLFEAKAQFEHQVAGIAKQNEQELTIGVIGNVGAMVVPELIKNLSETVPFSRFNIVELESSNLVESVRTGKLIAGFGLNDFLHPSLKFVELFPTQVHIAVNAAHPLAQKEELELSEMANEPFIFPNFGGASSYYSGLFDHHNIRPNTRYMVNSTEMARRLIEEGLGYSTFNARPSIHRHNPEPMIKRIPLKTDYWSPTFGMFYLLSSTFSNALNNIEKAARATWRQSK